MEIKRAVKFRDSGELKLFSAYGILLSERDIQSGTHELALNTKLRDYYTFNGVKFLVVAGEGECDFAQLVSAPKIVDLRPYVAPLNDRSGEFSVDVNFIENLDEYMIKRVGIYDKAEVKAFNAFFRAMDKNEGVRLFRICECERLDCVLAQRVYKSRQKEIRCDLTNLRK